jgi:lipopolysaccharide transport protein LptA
MSAVSSLADRLQRRRGRPANALALALALAPALTGVAASSDSAQVSDATGATAVAATASTEQLPLQPPPAAPACNEPLCYTASSLQAERNHLVLTDIEIVDTTRGTTQIKADHAEATGLDLGNSRWVLTGHVQVYLPQGQLQAREATVQFTDKHIASIAADGSPAQFQRQVVRTGQTTPTDVTGHAQQITYNVARDEVQLTGNSWLTDGCNDISTQQITYDIASQRVEAAAATGAPGADGRVHGTIGARSGAPCAPTATP